MSEIKMKRLGTSTAIALEILSKAIKKPGAAQKVYDHTDSEAGFRTVVSYIQEVAKFLNLDVTVEKKGKMSYYVTSNHYGYAVDVPNGTYKPMTLEERRGLHEIKMEKQ